MLFLCLIAWNVFFFFGHIYFFGGTRVSYLWKIETNGTFLPKNFFFLKKKGNKIAYLIVIFVLLSNDFLLHGKENVCEQVHMYVHLHTFDLCRCKIWN